MTAIWRLTVLARLLVVMVWLAPRAWGTGDIQGTVSDGAVAGLSGVWVDAYDTATNYLGSGYTDGDGLYTVYGLAAGSCYLRTDAGAGNYLDEWYPDARVDGWVIPAAAQPVTVLEGQVVSGQDFVLTEGVSLAGWVTTVALGPLSNVWVDAYNSSGVRVESAVSETNGAYTLAGLPAGTYYVRTDATGADYADEWFDNVSALDAAIPAAAKPIVLLAGSSTNAVNFALAVGGGIRGRVTTAALAPLSNVWVDVYASDGETWVDSGLSRTTGVYLVTGLPAGTYYARTYAGGSLYADKWYSNVPVTGIGLPTNATPLDVTAGAVTANTDFRLEPGGTVSGRVYNAALGLLAGVRVEAYTGAGAWVAAADSDAAGVYTLPRLTAATYYLRTYSGSANYVDEWYGGVAAGSGGVPAGAVGVVVPGGAVTGAVDFVLARGGVLTGSVRTTAMAPLAGVSVDAYAADGAWAVGGTTDAAGAYRIAGLSPGAYRVRTSVEGLYADEWYDDVPVFDGELATNAQALTVVSGATNAGIDFVLAVGGTVSGLVTDAVATPLSGVGVGVYTAAGLPVKTTTTAYNGVYAIQGLPAGLYRVRTTAGAANYVDAWYKNLTVRGSGVPDAATPVGVALGTVTGRVDFALATGGRVAGRVANSDGQALANAEVDAYDAQTNWLKSAASDSTGAYVLSGLPATGPVCVRSYVGSQAYADEWFRAVPLLYGAIPATARRVPLTAGVTTNGIDFSLAAAAAIGGALRDAGGSPLVGLRVDLFDAAGNWRASTATDAAGAFHAGQLPSGAYYLRTSAVGTGFVDEWFDDVLVTNGLPSQARAVVVAAGGVSNGVDFILPFAITAAGTLSNRFTCAWQAASGTTYRVRLSGSSFAWTNAPAGAPPHQQNPRTSLAQTILTYESPTTTSNRLFYRVEIVP